MENLNAEQIKNDMEHCINDDCDKCSVPFGNCQANLIESAISLITSQEQKIKELTEENSEVKANWQKLKDSYDNNDKEWREAYADSQSKWEKVYEKLELTLEGVMHSVDKWLDGAELEQDEVNRAATMREKTLQIIERLTEENERLKDFASSKCADCAGCTADKCDCANIEADTVRKMQKRLNKECLIDRGYEVLLEGTIDQIAKEMLEDG